MKTGTKPQVQPATICAALAVFTALGLLAGCQSAPKPQAPAVALTDKPEPAVAKPAAIKPAPASPDPAVVQAAAAPASEFEGTGWKSLYDGRTLNGWQATDFAGGGSTECESGLIVIESGDALSGINYTNGELPKMNYEIALDAMKLKGSDFFCGLTFPVGNTFCSLILGGWGGETTGLSSVDDEDASENETARSIRYEPNRWHRVRVRVTEKKIEAWLDQDKIVDLKTTDHRIGLRFGEIEMSKPLGLATYQTRAAFREIKIRTLDAGQ